MAEQKFPKKLEIMGIPYKVEYFDSLSNVDVRKQENSWGQIDFLTKTIRIFQEDCFESVWQTIWHEIIHGIFYHLNITIDDDKEENVVDMLSLGVNKIMLDYFKFKGEKNVKPVKKTKKKVKKH